MTHRKISIATMMIAIIVITISGMLAVGGLFAYRYYSEKRWTDFRQTLELEAEQISIALAPAAWNLEYPQVGKLMESQLRDPHFRAVAVDLETKRFNLERDASGAVHAQNAPPQEKELIVVQRPIVYSDQNIGQVDLYASPHLIEEELRQALAFITISIVFLDFILTLGLYLSLQRLILRPLHRVERYADDVANGRSAAANLDSLNFVGELDHLTRSIDTLLRQLSSRNLELHKSSERFATVIKLLPVPIALYDDNGNTVFLNDRFLETFGYSTTDIPDVNTWLTLAYPDPDYRREVVAIWHRELAEAERSAHPVRPLVYRVSCKDRSQKIVEIGGMLSENVNIAVLNDITDRTRTEQELVRHREHLEELVTLRTSELAKTYQRLEETQFAMDHAGIGIAWIDPVNGHFIYVNDQACELFGRHRDEVLAMHVVQMVQEFTHENSRGLAANLIASGHTRVELNLSRPDGNLLPVEASLYFQPASEERPGHYIAFLTDITQRKEAESALISAKQAAETAAQARSEFLANMSHEIRTPMNAIIGMSQLALDTTLDKRQRNFIEKVHLSAVSLLGILNDILDFSKVEAGRLEIEHLDFPLERVFDNLATLMSLRAEEKGIELLFDIAPDTPMQLVGDPMRLGQILINLAGNAVKFTEMGTVVVSCRPVEPIPDGVRLEFAIRDTGIGMSEGQVAGLFSPFKQGDNSISRRYGGTGLGLAICKRLSELMNGEIRIESQLGKGSTFTLSVPLGLPVSCERKELLLPESLRGERALVVDDNPDSLAILCGLINHFGMAVDRAASAREALSMMMRPDERYRLLLCDWKMPDMDGIDLVNTLTTTPGITLPPSIIMVSAYGVDELRRRTSDLPLSGILTKPVSPSALLDILLDATGNNPTNALPRDEGLAPKKTCDLSGTRLLLVEDNAINRELAEEILLGAGASITVAGNGKEALEKLSQQDFDCVLMDVQMPVMDGLEATRRIRSDARWHTLPIIAMTAGAMASEREETAQAGMNGHITKPIDIDELFSAISQLLHRSPHLSRKADNPALPEPSTALPLDVAKCLSNLRGNHKTYQRILGIFLENTRTIVDNLLLAATARDRSEMRSLAHTLKGSCGSIGAELMQQVAKDLESALRQDADESSIAGLVERIAPAWKITRNAAQQQLALEQNGLWSDDMADSTQRRLLESLGTLRTQLLSDDADALETLDALLDHPMSDAMRLSLNELARHVTRYQFDTALLQLQKILDGHPATFGIQTP